MADEDEERGSEDAREYLREAEDGLEREGVLHTDSAIGSASGEAFDRLNARITEAGGSIECAFLIVLADGIEPNGGVFFSAEGELAEDPQGVLDVALSGLGEWARVQGLPFAVMDMPSSPPGGQG